MVDSELEGRIDRHTTMGHTDVAAIVVAHSHNAIGMSVAKKKSGMSAEHKAALAKGRAQSKAVREYLSMLQEDGRRSSNLSPDQLNQKIHELQAKIDETDNPATRLELIQRRIDLEEQLGQTKDAADPEELEKAFVESAKEYSERKGISYSAWREVGVPASVLKQAGIARTRRPSN